MSRKEDNVIISKMMVENWEKHGRGYEVELRPEMAFVTALHTVVAKIYYDGRVELFSSRNVALKYLEKEEYEAGGSGFNYLYDDVELVIYVLRGYWNGGEPYLEFVLSSPDSERGTFRFSAGYHEIMDFDAAKNFDKMVISDITKRRCKDGELDKEV